MRKTIYQTLILLAGCVAGMVQADPPRTLNTTFADYAQQQKQHDAQLQHTSQIASAQPKVASGKAHSTRTSSAKGSSKNNKSSNSNKSSTPININQADATSLSNTLNGVGPAKALAIVEYRQAHGGFKSIDELVEVKGIGPATLEKNRHLLRLN